MTAVFQQMLCLAEKLGTVTGANLYPFGYVSISGKTAEGALFQLTLDIRKKEEKENVV